MRRFFFWMVLCLIAGCGTEAPGELIPLERLPDGHLKTAQESLPDVQFENALKRSDGSYEVRGKDKKGKVRDVEMSASGEVLEIE
jgi:hypothetical protein